jgi:hypothetical protein
MCSCIFDAIDVPMLCPMDDLQDINDFVVFDTNSLVNVRASIYPKKANITGIEMILSEQETACF